MKKLLPFLLLGVSAVVLAAGTTASVSFTPVTEYSDDTPLPASDILKYTIKWQGGSQDVPPTALCPTGGRICADVPVPCGDRVFTVVVVPKATAKYPVPSADSASVPYASGVVCRPKAVSGVQAS